MKMLIIHNFEREDRFNLLMDELSKQGIYDFKLIPSVHDVMGVKHGINKAHKNCVRYAKDHKLDEIIIAEDDVRFTHPDSFQYFLKNKPQSFDLYLSGIYLGDIVDGKVKSFSGLHLYIVHSKFYDKFLSVPTDEHIDRALGGLGDFHVCYPFAAIQYNGYSQNAMCDMNYDSLLQGRELFNGG